MCRKKKQRKLQPSVINSCESIRQLPCNAETFKTHDAFLCAAEAQKIDTAVPGNTLVNNRKLLMKTGPIRNSDAITLQVFRTGDNSGLILFSIFLRRPGYDLYSCFIQNGFGKECYKTVQPSDFHERAYNQYFVLRRFQILTVDRIEAFSIVNQVGFRLTVGVCPDVISDGGVSF